MLADDLVEGAVIAFFASDCVLIVLVRKFLELFLVEQDTHQFRVVLLCNGAFVSRWWHHVVH